MSNIIFIGNNSVGKTRVGFRVAQKLNMIHIDEDDFFESQFGLIHKIKQEVSEDEYQAKFLQIRKFFTSVQNTVISAGGTTGTLDIVKEYNGIIIHIKPNIECILKKYAKLKKDKSSRNLRRKVVFLPENEIIEEVKRRDILYSNNADIIIDSSWKKKKDVAKETLDRILEFKKNQKI